MAYAEVNSTNVPDGHTALDKKRLGALSGLILQDQRLGEMVPVSRTVG